MTEFRDSLRNEYLKRTSKNPRYSLRAFASAIGLNHATVSGFLSGRRKISPASAEKIGRALGWSPDQISGLAGSAQDYRQLTQDEFAMLSDWSYDAILEYSRLPRARMEAKAIAEVFDLPELQVRLTLEALERLGFLSRRKKKLVLTDAKTTSILDPSTTSSAQSAHQKNILEKSAEAIDRIAPAGRDHTSMTFAVDRADLHEARRRIAKFRRELDKFLQRAPANFNEVYQLQISLFPLTGGSHDT